MGRPEIRTSLVNAIVFGTVRDYESIRWYRGDDLVAKLGLMLASEDVPIPYPSPEIDVISASAGTLHNIVRHGNRSGTSSAVWREHGWSLFDWSIRKRWPTKRLVGVIEAPRKFAEAGAIPADAVDFLNSRGIPVVFKYEVYGPAFFTRFLAGEEASILKAQRHRNVSPLGGEKCDSVVYERLTRCIGGNLGSVSATLGGIGSDPCNMRLIASNYASAKASDEEQDSSVNKTVGFLYQQTVKAQLLFFIFLIPAFGFSLLPFYLIKSGIEYRYPTFQVKVFLFIVFFTVAQLFAVLRRFANYANLQGYPESP